MVGKTHILDVKRSITWFPSEVGVHVFCVNEEEPVLRLVLSPPLVLVFCRSEAFIMMPRRCLLCQAKISKRHQLMLIYFSIAGGRLRPDYINVTQAWSDT